MKLPSNHPARVYVFHVVRSRTAASWLETAYVLFNGKTRNTIDAHRPRCLEEAMAAAFAREKEIREIRPIAVYDQHPQKVDRAGDLRGVIVATAADLEQALRAKQLIDALYALAEPTVRAGEAATATGHAPCIETLTLLQDADADAMAAALAYYDQVGMAKRIRPWNPLAAYSRAGPSAPQ